VCSAADKGESARVTAVRFWSLGDVTRIAIEVSSGFTFKSDHLTAPERLFFDVHGAKPELGRTGMYAIPVGDGLVTQIRVAETQPDVTRVVLDLTQAATVTTSQLTNPNRLMIELRSKDRPLPPSAPSVSGGKDLTAPALDARPVNDTPVDATPVKAASAKAAPVKSTPVKAIPANTIPANTIPANTTAANTTVANTRAVNATPAGSAKPGSDSVPGAAAAGLTAPKIALPGVAAKGTSIDMPALREAAPVAAPEAAGTSLTGPSPTAARRGSGSLTRALGLKLERVVLDAGHGGNDVGTHGPSGFLEKDLTLDVTRRLGALLEERMGSEVVYTRSDDTYVGLEERTRIANEREADLFLSIHANSSPYHSAAGAETYVLNFTTSKTALELAARENASAQSSIHDLHGLLDKIALKDKIDESRELAAALQTSLSSLSTRSTEAARNRGVKKAPFVVLIGAAMPSVLAEIGFLTNASEEALLRQAAYRQKIAEALYKGIEAYAQSLSRTDVARKN